MILKDIKYEKPINNTEFPFNLEWLDDLNNFKFTHNVTFFVGDNGIGKSTLLEAIAINADLITLSDVSYNEDDQYENVRILADALKLSWSIKTKRGFFFRSDDFITFIRETKKRKGEALAELARIEFNMTKKAELEKIPHLNTLYALKNLYGTDLHKLSHGQSFLTLFEARLRPKGIYILDEPDTPLTPQNELRLLYLIHEQVKQGSQFIISTHSPVLLAYPYAKIIKISERKLQETSYEEVENVDFMLNFMNNYKRIMHYTLED